MVFELKKWGIKARESDDSIEKEMYGQKWRLARRELINEYANVFRPKYYNPKYKCYINDSYLERVVLPEILRANVFLPYDLRTYIGRKHPEYRDRLFEVKDIFRKNGLNASVYGSGLKWIRSDISFRESLMFEVWEFTLTYPEFKELFVEEWN